LGVASSDAEVPEFDDEEPTFDKVFDSSVLQPCDAIGCCCVVTGLASRIELNGRIGIIKRFDSERRRYIVEDYVNKKTVLIRPCNLREALSPEMLVCPVCQTGDVQSVAVGCSYCKASPSAKLAALRLADPHCLYLQRLGQR